MFFSRTYFRLLRARWLNHASGFADSNTYPNRV
jgi:hypothetical protein